MLSVVSTPAMPQEGTISSPLRIIVSQPNATPHKPKIPMSNKIALPTMEGINFEYTADIISLEAQGNYTMIHFIDGRQILVCKTLNLMEEALEEDCFVRVHRSATINMNRIKQYLKGKGGHVVMENNRAIPVSEGKKQEFLDALKEAFKF